MVDRHLVEVESWDRDEEVEQIHELRDDPSFVVEHDELVEVVVVLLNNDILVQSSQFAYVEHPVVAVVVVELEQCYHLQLH